ncbi:hypothetical protein M422DRAFT_264876 [Sphaerobolus stellatus SS14]|uniref:CCHC-type domain-containing protein n=1 Tax=Sphaerobolus stellatus (strain SS14) TaxID=990650 RepID=A0A0C9TSA9_SPHS4|nr:hypothetical protein M422DRAFT_264876 [Sphaerobolus stellatus SS14]
MDLEQVVTDLCGQYIPSLARCEASNKFDFIKQGTLSMQEFATELKLYASQMVLRPDIYSLRKKFVDNLWPGLRSLLLRTGNSSNVPGGAGPPIINRQRTNHDSSHNSIECYNCGKSGHIKPNCPEPLRARRVEAVHIEDSPTDQVDDTNHDINNPIDDERPTEDEYHNEDYDNQLDLSEDQRSWGSKPSKFDWSDDDQVR